MQTKNTPHSIKFGDRVQIKGFVIGLFLYASILLYRIKMSMGIILFLSF